MSNNVIIQIGSQELQKLIETAVFTALGQSKLHPEPKQLFNIKEAADYLKLAVQTIYSYTSQGTIPFFKKGKRLYFRKTDLDYWLTGGFKT
jgi:excisionase family DNA binding protein